MISRIHLWISAFIPRDIEALTSGVAAGPHRGKTKIDSPIGPWWYLTDQRGFSDDPGASARMHHAIVLRIAGPALAVSIDRESPRCDPTVELEKPGGSVTCSRAAPANRFRTASLRVTGLTATFRALAEASNPCFRGAPDIDWNLGLTFTFAAGLGSVTVSVDGVVEPFPAFEMHARADDGPVRTVFRIPPTPGATPWNLAGGPTKRVASSIPL